LTSTNSTQRANGSSAFTLDKTPTVVVNGSTVTLNVAYSSRLQVSVTININVTMYNATGATIFSNSMLSPGLVVAQGASFSRSIDLGPFPAGTYFVAFEVVDNVSGQEYSSPSSILFSVA